MNGFEKIIEFWFEELAPSQWWDKSPELDREIHRRFGDLRRRAAMGELYPWRNSPHGRLAEILILDQFSRNIYRDLPEAFASDAMALALSQEAIHQNAALALNAAQQAFLYMPFMHSESLLIQRKSMELFGGPGLEGNYEFAKRHLEIIERFGRFPHRNKILGRPSTPEEEEFLTQPNSSF